MRQIGEDDVSPLRNEEANSQRESEDTELVTCGPDTDTYAHPLGLPAPLKAVSGSMALCSEA